MTVSRFRVEGGMTCIDIQLKSVRQLFDLRDPAPFRERDLDPAAADHIRSTVQELPLRLPLKLVLHVTEPFDDPMVDVVRDAIRHQFEYERGVVQLKIRRTIAHGRRIAALGFAVLALFLILAETASAKVPEGPLRRILGEGFTIMGWVALWRPLETLLYDWLPLVEERRWLDKIIAMKAELRHSRGVLAAKGA